MKPIVLSQIRGHQLIRASLQRLLANHKTGHAYLLEGPAGIGKTALAWAFLGRLACPVAAATDIDPCGTCRSCVAWQRGDHPDLQRLVRDGAGIKIEQVRQAGARLHFDPVLGAIKGVLIEDADLLNEHAANALLKTLEEPPSQTVFLLVTAHGQQLLDTIRSRCQVLRLHELSEADVEAVLLEEGRSAQAAAMAAGLALGSLHQARLLCDPRRLALVEMIVEYVCQLGTSDTADPQAWTDQLVVRLAAVRKPADEDDESEDDEAPVARPAKKTGKDTLEREDLVEVLGIARSCLRDAMVVGAGAGPHLLAHRTAANGLTQLAARAGALRLATLLDRLDQLEAMLTFYPPPRQTWTTFLTEAHQLVLRQ
jgi:DNA polymerase III delta' subunit